jgi:hypothetical protein
VVSVHHPFNPAAELARLVALVDGD